MKKAELLKKIEDDENYFSTLDYAIAHADYELLDFMLKKHWDNQLFRKAISNNLLANILEKAPISDFIRYVLDRYDSGFTYEDQHGKTYSPNCRRRGESNWSGGMFWLPA